MSARFFLDTNIFVYSLDRAAPAKAARATALIRNAVGTRKGIISFQVVQEFINLALRRFAEPMSPVEAEQYLLAVLRPLVAIHSSQSLYAEALRLFGRHSLSWHDALIIAAALQGECAVLYSEDLQHGRRFEGLCIENPFL
ncbi:MAG TPA: PIN domain-containing protein [Terriglobia bacterium]|nr:PIN domain-containing protein [Terriglobia bacterium]